MSSTRKPYRRRLGSACARSLGSIVFLLAVRLAGQSPGGISTEGPFTVFRTGSNEPLLTLSLPFAVPPTNFQPVLRLDFGFATAEPEAAGTFFDSFSLTLQGPNPSHTVLLLTTDRTGVQLTPPTSGGMTVDPAQVQQTPISFPPLSPDLALKFAFSVGFALPTLLTGGPLTLFLDLFDNLNGAASLAFVRNVRIDSLFPGVKLFSAPGVDGPFTEETAARHAETNRTLTVSVPSGPRYYLVQADRPTRIVDIHRSGPDLVIEYRFEEFGQLVIQTAPAPGGPFAPDTNAVWNPTNRTFTVPRPNRNWFFRIEGDRTSRITGIQAVASQVVIEYQLVSLQLHSAAALSGPYREQSIGTLNETNRTFTLNQPAANQFYRVFSDVPTRLTSSRASGNQLVLEYEFNP